MAAECEACSALCNYMLMLFFYFLKSVSLSDFPFMCVSLGCRQFVLSKIFSGEAGATPRGNSLLIIYKNYL